MNNFFVNEIKKMIKNDKHAEFINPRKYNVLATQLVLLHVKDTDRKTKDFSLANHVVYCKSWDMKYDLIRDRMWLLFRAQRKF